MEQLEQILLVVLSFFFSPMQWDIVFEPTFKTFKNMF
jgi:hypothetical protein